MVELANWNHAFSQGMISNLKIYILLSPKRKVQDLMDSLLNSIRPLRKNWYQPSLNCSTKQKGKENCQTHFMKPVLHLPKTKQRHLQKREL
jgi:hypothetical protein